MQIHTNKQSASKGRASANTAVQKKNDGEAVLSIPEDKRPETVTQRKLQAMADSHLTVTTGKSPHITPALAPVLRPVVQREILVGATWYKPYDDTLAVAQRDAAKPYLKQWGQMEIIFDKGTAGKTRAAKEAYLTDQFENDIRAMLRKYNGKKSFSAAADLTRQLVQDIKLKLLGLNAVIGTEHTDGQFSEKADDGSTGRSGKSKTLRIYRTMKKEDWERYEASNDPKDILRGHGGSLGQALHYFLKSKADKLDDVLVEFEFANTASNLVDYTRIQHGGEGKEPYGGKLTGKAEANDTMGLDEDIFSINLGKSKELITELKPKITLKDKVK